MEVSEYKRPTFTLSFDEITQKYVEGDTVKVHGKAMSFAGVGLQKAQVRYTIRRRHVSLAGLLCGHHKPLW